MICMKKAFSNLTAAIILTATFAACTADVTTLPTSVTLDQSAITLSPGESLTLTAGVFPDEAAIKTLTWSSSDPDVATVTDGVVTAIAEGMATIIVTTMSGKKTETCVVTVTYSVRGVALDKVSALMPVGQSLILSAIITPDDAPDKTLTWTSSDPAAVTVVNGIITAKAPGTATITVTSEVGDKTAKCAVTVVPENYMFIFITFQPLYYVSFIMSGSGPAFIDWNDGNAFDSYTLSEKLSSHYHNYAYKTPLLTVTIAGENITGFLCDAYQITGLDVDNITTLTTLSCSNNSLTSLDVSNNTALTNLSCIHNQLTSLDVSSNTALINLSCDYNRLSDLKLSGTATTLKSLSCSNNQLSGLNLNGFTALTILNCMNNQLTGLSVTGATALTTLNCYNNQLTDLEMKEVTALTTMNCNDNRLKGLDVSEAAALINLNCQFNLLTSLNVSDNPALSSLSCQFNQLTSLDVSKSIALTKLECLSNKITYLDVSKNTILTSLNCSWNQLTNLDVSKNATLTRLDCSLNQLTSLDVSNNPALLSLYCNDNRLTSLDVNIKTLTRLDCSSNQLSAEELNAIFRNLPRALPFTYSNFAHISANPGTDTCDRSIATEKGWFVF